MLQLEYLHGEFDLLQKKHGAAGLDCICGAGCVENPSVCFIFMNPTGRNVSSRKSWTGLKAPWLGTKNVWKLFAAVGVLSEKTLKEILARRPEDWDYDFARAVYREVAEGGAYITNLGKCAMDDALPVKDSVFKEYLGLLEEEVRRINPKKIITFGNQVSSLFLGAPVKVSESRKIAKTKIIDGKAFEVWPVHYPVGQGMRNMPLAIEDIIYAIKSQK